MCEHCRALQSRRSMHLKVAATSAPPFLATTPLQSAAGGALLGATSATKLILNGRVLGISGTTKNLLLGSSSKSEQAERLAFTLSLCLGGVLLGVFCPQCFDHIPAAFPAWRMSLAGLLVGVGAALGNGCTSGQGLSGNARLSLRSFVFTVLIMLSGGASATAFNTASELAVAGASTAILSSTEAMSAGVFTLTLLVGAFLLRHQHRFMARAAVEGASGFAFAHGLALSGMVKPFKVAAFLSFLSNLFDAGLVFVMGTALLVLTPITQLVLRRNGSKPMLADDYSSIPKPSSLVDARLVTGALLFGLGWGLAGLCPGPALVSLSALGSFKLLAFVGTMLVGLVAPELIQPVTRSIKRIQ